MSNDVVLQIALANTGHAIDADEVYKYIENNINNVAAYWLDPQKTEGRCVAAAIDFALVFNGIAAVAAVISAAPVLWNAYQKFIEPHKPENDTAGIYISIPRCDNSRTELWIGGGDNDRDTFISKFELTVKEISEDKDGSSNIREIIVQIQQDEFWSRRK
jgi:hypothetical protein